MKKYLFILIFNNLYSQTVNLTNWVIDTIPIKNATYKANNSYKEWEFEQVKDSVICIREFVYKKSIGDSLPFSDEFLSKKFDETNDISHNRIVRKVKNGFLVAYNRGEFGGELYFISTDGKESYLLRNFIRIRQFFELNSKVYALEGLSHLGSSCGGIFEINFNKTWNCKYLIKLMEAPILITFRDKIGFIITDQYVLKLNSNLSIENVIKIPFYLGMFYPTSVCILDNDLYIAMRKGVLKVEKFESKPNYVWYIPKL